MQRRSTNASSAAPGVPVGTATTTTAPKPRRKVRRSRRSSSLSMISNEEVQSLIVVAIVTSFLTASFVWLGAKAYTALIFNNGNNNGGNYHQVHMRDNNGKKKKRHHPPPQQQPNAPNQPQKSPADDDYDVLPWNPIYRIPESMEILGDRSDEYATLRKEMDAALPPDTTRSLQRVRELQSRYPPLQAHPILAASEPHHHSDEIGHGAAAAEAPKDDGERLYDIYHCPDEPPPGYPFEWNLVKDVLGHWPVTEVDDIPDNTIHQGLCVFDYHDDWEKALKYRQAELPFIVINDPDVARAVERWNIPGYMSQMLGRDTRHRVEYNTNSHFMYHQPNGQGRKHRRNKRKPEKPQPEGPPQDSHGRIAELQRKDVNADMLRMTYDEWLEKANKTHVGFEEEHWYFRLIGCGYMDTEGGCDQGSSEYLYDELPFFQPREDGRNGIYMAEPEEQKGIHCRFGMKNVIAENHFDATRNAIVVLGGRRRYILSHPKQCENLALLPLGHDSARHSAVDYADPDLDRFPEFADAKANEVVMEAGMVMYLPTFWFHYIVSLDLNMQCNTRSGMDHVNHKYIRECGFK